MLERVFIDVDGVKVSLLKGRGRKVFYIHSSGSDATQWVNQLTAIGVTQ